MKKEYIKPIMESEMFIPNEYCTTCSVIKCVSTDSEDSDYDHDGKNEEFVMKGEPIYDRTLTNADSDGDGFYKNIAGNLFYNGDKFEHAGSSYLQFTLTHKIEVTDAKQYNNGFAFEINGKVYGPNFS